MKSKLIVLGVIGGFGLIYKKLNDIHKEIIYFESTKGINYSKKERDNMWKLDNVIYKNFDRVKNDKKYVARLERRYGYNEYYINKVVERIEKERKYDEEHCPQD